MRSFFTILLVCGCCLAPSVRADGAVAVTLPPLPEMSQQDKVLMLDRLVVANVISSNCQGFEISDGEWSLLVGTADLIAAELGLDPEAYDRAFYGPAFDLLDDPANCAVLGPDVGPVIEMLIGMGGTTTAP
jgi:hypothetical protein